MVVIPTWRNSLRLRGPTGQTGGPDLSLPLTSWMTWVRSAYLSFEIPPYMKWGKNININSDSCCEDQVHDEWLIQSLGDGMGSVRKTDLCWRRLLRVPWTVRRSNQSILKEISPGCSLEGLMLKLKLQYFGHLMWRADSFEKTLMLGKIEDRQKRGQQMVGWHHQLNGHEFG